MDPMINQPSQTSFLIFSIFCFIFWSLCFYSIQYVFKKLGEISVLDGLASIYCLITSIGTLAGAAFLSAVYFTDEVTVLGALVLFFVFQSVLLFFGRFSFRFMMKHDGRIGELKPRLPLRVFLIKRQEKTIQVEQPAMAS